MRLIKRSANKLNKFIKESKDKREFLRALAVKMYLEGCTLKEIADHLNVSFQFSSKWKNKYLSEGTEALKLGYRGSTGYLTRAERKQVVDWLKQQPYCTVEKLRLYIAEHYGVNFCTSRSYHQLLKEANLSFKKSQKVNPKRKARQVSNKRWELKKNIRRKEA
jgi:transposase